MVTTSQPASSRTARRRDPDGPAGARPPVFRRHPFGQLALFAVVAIVATRPFVDDPVDAHYLNQWLMYAIAGVGFYLMFVVAGRFAFCQTFMMSTGGYVAAHYSDDHGFLFSMAAALVAVTVIAAIFAVVVARTESFLFAVATLALGQIGATVYVNWTDFTGPDGLHGNVPLPKVFGKVLNTEADMFWMFLVGLLLCLAIALMIERSAVGREAVATRELAQVARSTGIATRKLQVVLFVLGSAMGGLAGAMTAYWQGSMSTGTFSLDLALGLFLIPILGGVTSVWGTALGALIYVELTNVLSDLAKYASLVYGIALLVVIVALPQGLMGAGHQLVRRLFPGRARSQPIRSVRSMFRGGGSNVGR